MEEMTKDEMQKIIDEEMREGKTWREALEKLARILGIRPAEVKAD